MSTLTELVSAVMALVVDEVPGTVWAEGGRELDVRRAPPSVVWCRVAARAGAAALRHADVRSYDRAILGLAQGYEVRLWGADTEQLDALRVALVRALEDLAEGQYEYEGDTQVGVGVVAAGEATVARVTLACHVPSRPVATVAVGSVATPRNPSAASGDRVLEPGDP